VFAKRTSTLPKSALPIVAAVQQQPTLARMVQQQHASEALWQSTQACVPVAMRGAVRAGPLQEGSWCLIAANSAVAAKLRQLQPFILNAAQQQGHGDLRLRITLAGRSDARG
jgi:hypothetical protein